MALLDDERHSSAHNAIDKLIRCYERFLETSNFNKKELRWPGFHGQVN